LKLEDAIKSWTSRAGVVRVRKALNPLLWMAATAFPTSLLGAYFLRDVPYLKYLLVMLGAFPVLATLVAYFILLFRDPDRLQSEEFVLRQQELTIYRRSEEGGPRPLETNDKRLPNVAESEVQTAEEEGEPS
jgi:hypothetical protein